MQLSILILLSHTLSLSVQWPDQQEVVHPRTCHKIGEGTAPSKLRTDGTPSSGCEEIRSPRQLPNLTNPYSLCKQIQCKCLNTHLLFAFTFQSCQSTSQVSLPFLRFHTRTFWSFGAVPAPSRSTRIDSAFGLKMKHVSGQVT